MDATTYPESPGWKSDDTETSREAAKSMAIPAKTLRDKCHAALKGSAMTADEVAELIGASVLSVRPRVSELKAQGKVEATAKRRCNVSKKTAVVWKAMAGNAGEPVEAQKPQKPPKARREAEAGTKPQSGPENAPTAVQAPAKAATVAGKRRKAVVRGVPIGGKEWDFWFCSAGVVVHRKHANHFKSVVVPFQHVATGAGLEVEVAGRVFRVAIRKEGLAMCEVKNHAHTKVLPWANLAWQANLADDSAVQPPLFKELV
jgi:hypothetical protein